jgi:hypothetical protein
VQKEVVWEKGLAVVLLLSVSLLNVRSLSGRDWLLQSLQTLSASTEALRPAAER